MPSHSRRRRCTGRRRSRGCSRGTHNSSGRWRRRNCRSPNNVRLIGSVLSIISKLHVCLVVDDPLNVWSIYHIGSSMVQNKHKLYPEEGTNAWKR
jgi:hypothetical protein